MEDVVHSQPNCLCTIRQTSKGQMILSFDTDMYTDLEHSRIIFGNSKRPGEPCNATESTEAG
jgi:hypothetical protein